MCFGSKVEKTQTSNQTQSMPSWLTDAASSNLGFATNLRQQGFTPYSGNQVASFSPQQRQSFGLGSDIASGVQPYVGQTGSLISNYANAAPQQVSADTIASRMSPYMNAYVEQALAPQLQMQDQQFAGQNKAVDQAATMAGAYGDTGWGQMRGTTTQAQNAARSGLIGQAYTNAFNTAIGAGAQDVANNLNAGVTNAGLAETALGRQLGGANALAGQGSTATNLINSLGGQQTAQDQAGLNALFNQYMMSQQYPFQAQQLANQTLTASRQGAPVTINGTQTTAAPDNSGWGMLGSALAIGAAPFTGGASLMALPAMSSMGGGATQGGTAMPFMPSGNVNPAYMADGGTLQPGRPTVVGERGPEVIIPNTTGVVIPNEVMRAAAEKRDKAKKKGKAPNIKFGIAA